MQFNQTYDESELLSRVAAGDKPAFTQLIGQYGGLVFHYIRQHARSRELAEEIVQDIFTQIWLARDTLPQVRNFKSFLFVVSRNYALNVLKKLSREKRRQQEWEQQAMPEDAVLPPEEDDWRLGLIARAVASLPPQQQKVWVLSRQEGLSHSEVAAQMNISKESVKKYMYLANGAIIKYIEDRMGILVALTLLSEKF